MKKNLKNFKALFAFVLLFLVLPLLGSYYYEITANSDDPDYLEAQKNPVNSNTYLTFEHRTVMPDAIQSLDTITLQANPGPANNGGSAGWAMFFDLIAHSNNLEVTQMSTANTGAASAPFSVEIYTRSGTALGGPVGSGPGSSTVGWTLLGTVNCVQGSVSSGISELFTIPTIQINAFDTVGVAVKFIGVGPRYFGTGTPPYSNYADSNLTLITGDGRSAPFTPTGSWFSSRALTGVVRYVVSQPSLPRVWSEQTSGVTGALYSVSAVDNNVAWTCGAAGKVLRTTDKGVTWTSVGAAPIPTSLALYNIYGIDASTALVTGSSSTGTFVYRTSNGGSTWTQVFTQTGGFMNAIVMSSSSNGFMTGDPVGGRWSLWKTVNGGVTWDSSGLYVAEPTSAGWNNSFFNLGNSWWFGTNSTNLKYSANNGTSWGNQTTPAANQYAVWFNSPTVGLAGGAQLYVTTNGGTTWSNLTSIGSGNISGIVGAGSEWWFTRQATAVNYSSNNGTSWTAQYTAPAGSFYHLAYSRSGNTIWGVRSNGGISRYGDPITGITPVNSQVPSDYALGQNYPNPFNPVTNIKFAIPKSGFVTLKIYDIIGREVATLVNEVKTAGTYVVDFDASRLSSGVYFYRIEVNGFKDVKRMTLIK